MYNTKRMYKQERRPGISLIIREASQGRRSNAQLKTPYQEIITTNH